MLREDMAYFVGHDREDLFVSKTFDELRIKYDHRSLNSTREGVRYRILLHKKIGHVHAERGAGYLQLRIEVRTLVRCNFHCARGKDYSNGRFPGHNQKSLQGGINSGNGFQCGKRSSVCRVDVLFLVQVGKLLVSLFRKG